MTGLINFKNENGKELRIITKEDGNIWFVAKDVCSIIGLEQVTNAIKSLDDEEKGVTKVKTLVGGQETNIISESGLYTLIMRSNKSEAKVFRKWVMEEVLPSIRKSGNYSIEKPKTTLELLELAVSELNLFLNNKKIITLC